MVGKLLKHEFKATSKLMLVLFAALFGVTFLCLALEWFDFDSVPLQTASGLVTAGYVLLLISSYFISLAYMVVRFYRSMLGDEGYLTFTLPVTTTQLVISKLLTAVVWLVLTGCVMIGSLVLLSHDSDFLEQIFEAFGRIFSNSGIVLTIVIYLVLLLVGIFSSMLQYYTAMAFGQTFSSHKILWSVIGYFLLNIAISFVNMFVMLISGNFSAAVQLDETEVQIADMDQYLSVLNRIVGVQIAEYIILSVVLFLICRSLLKHKLNLQ